jgi:hypothetical protein
MAIILWQACGLRPQASGGEMISRREVVTAGLFGRIAGSSRFEPAEVQESQAIREGFKSVEDALKDVRDSVDQGLRGSSMNFGHVGEVRDKIEKFTKANGKFPEFCEIGLSVFYAFYDWHVRHQQQIQISRVADQRMAIQFMFTQLILRPETDLTYIGTPFDR